ncbi:MAG: cellulase family glycosylhydrolase, partial [Verrucomicrobiales bacterium]|nr:cellulase family glycosylhydrolase [Verrucomicrobiales bacterium]
GNTNSLTIAFMRTYLTNVISRYSNSPAIWGWEFGNEYNSSCDLMDQGINNGIGLPQISVANGTPSFRTTNDLPYSTNFLVAFADFARTVRTMDPTRLICNGNGVCAPNQYNRFHNSWTVDTDVQFSNILSVYNQSFNTTHFHIYPQQIPYGNQPQFLNRPVSFDGYIQASMAYANAMQKPLFIGEWGASAVDAFGTNNLEWDRTNFANFMNVIVSNQVPLSAVWVFDFIGQAASCNISWTNARSYMLDQVAMANNQMYTEMGLSPAQYVLNVTQSTNGTITPGLVVVNQGANQTYAIAATNANYRIISVTVDGVNQGAVTTYTFTNVSAAHSITALFQQVPVVQVPLSATAITYGQMLSSSVLSGTFTNTVGTVVPGTLAFAVPTLVPNPGTTNVPVVFTPTDGTTYATVTNTVNVTQLPSQTPPTITTSVSGGALTLNWPLANLGYRLLQQTNNLNKGVSGNTNDWGTVSGSTATNGAVITITNSVLNKYYRLVYP